MKIVSAHISCQRCAGEDIFLQSAGEPLWSESHQVVEYPRSNYVAKKFVSVRRLTREKRTIWNSGTRREFRQLLLRERLQIANVYNTSFCGAIRSHMDNHVPLTPFI